MFIIVGHYAVRPGHTVYINDSTIFHTPGENANLAQQELHRRDPQVQLRVFSSKLGLVVQSAQSTVGDPFVDVAITGYTAHFGLDISSSSASNNSPTSIPSIQRLEGIAVHRDPINLHACVPFQHDYPDSALIVHRGQCTFLEKLINARAASASAIIVISDENVGVNPTANLDELEAAGDLSDSTVLLLPKKTGEAFEEMLIATENIGAEQIRVSVNPHFLEQYNSDAQHTTAKDKEEQDKEPTRILYVNGHPLINTQLLV